MKINWSLIPTRPFIGGRFLEIPAQPIPTATLSASSAHVKRLLINPSTGDPLPLEGLFDCTKDEVDMAVNAARTAFETEYRSWTGSQRRDALLDLAASMKQESEMLAISEAITGKPIKDARADVEACIECFKFFAGIADKIHGRTFNLNPNYRSYTLKEPIGVCGLITSFNYPLLLTTWKLAPALATGNTCIIKPSAQTPFSTLFLAHLAETRTQLPKGTVNVVLGDADVGSWLVSHAGVDKVSFTGSTPAGKRVSSLASVGTGSGNNGNEVGPKKLTLELGGKNAVIVCDDADLEAAATHVVEAGFSNMGQNCCAGSRLLLHESIHDRFLQILKDKVSTFQIGDHLDETTQLGPLVDERAFNKVMGYINLAPKSGAKLLCGVYFDVPDSSPLATEEVFGPIVAVLEPFKTIEEALTRANNTPYGLASGIFTSSQRTADTAIASLKAGFVWVNCYNDVPPYLPLGGVKASGYGKDVGYESVDEFTNVKSVHIQF
ncbi:hypothetical protein HDV05_003315 [Chytridiales sp. JEL 0842]|nr:hypothetical protein HDV05_003315 [Chytridiales sp. JEL 0842]